MIDCDPTVRAGCIARMATLEQAVERLRRSNETLAQSNRELLEAVHKAVLESGRRSEALDELARKLLASDSGLKLLRTTSASLKAI